MISVACSHCGSKFRVKGELVGRSGACPPCKQSLTVPRPSVAQGADPTGKIEA